MIGNNFGMNRIKLGASENSVIGIFLHNVPIPIVVCFTYYKSKIQLYCNSSFQRQVSNCKAVKCKCSCCLESSMFNYSFNMRKRICDKVVKPIFFSKS
jgi:hypothetical protein